MGDQTLAREDIAPTVSLFNVPVCIVLSLPLALALALTLPTEPT